MRKIHTNSYELAQIDTNFILKFLHEIHEKFVHEFVHKFMPEDYVSKENIWGKVCQYHSYNLRSSSAEFFLHGQTLRYVDIIEGNILFEII